MLACQDQRVLASDEIPPRFPRFLRWQHANIRAREQGLKTGNIACEKKRGLTTQKTVPSVSSGVT